MKLTLYTPWGHGKQKAQGYWIKYLPWRSISYKNHVKYLGIQKLDKLLMTKGSFNFYGSDCYIAIKYEQVPTYL